MVQERLSAPAPDLVFHLAAVSGPTLHLQNPEIVMAVNAVGTVNVLTLLDDVRVDISGHS